LPTRNFGIIFEREIDEELMLIRIGIAAQLQGVSASTLRRWEKDGKMLPYGRTRGGHRRYKLSQSVEQKQGWKITRIFTDIASGMNTLTLIIQCTIIYYKNS